MPSDIEFNIPRDEEFRVACARCGANVSISKKELESQFFFYCRKCMLKMNKADIIVSKPVVQSFESFYSSHIDSEIMKKTPRLILDRV